MTGTNRAAVYRVEVGSATYWMLLDDASIEGVMRALADAGDESPREDVGVPMPLSEEALDRVCNTDDGPLTWRELAAQGTAPVALACSEWP